MAKTLGAYAGLDEIGKSEDAINLFKAFKNANYFGFYGLDNSAANQAARDRFQSLTGIDPNNLSTLDEAQLALRGIDEKKLLEAQASKQRDQINDFSKEFETSASNYRNTLAGRLAETGKQTFEQSNPYILEDLNARGFASSPSEVANAQARALADISLKNQGILTAFDTDAFNNLNDLKRSGLETYLGGNQDALSSILESRRSGLERSFNIFDQERQKALAEELAKQQQRASLTNALISAGGTIAGAYAGKGG